MQMTVEQVQGRVPVTVLKLHGDLDASNYEEVIAKARALYAAGTRSLVIDMHDVQFMGSSGLVALLSVARLLRGKEPPDPEYGWQAFHEIDDDRNAGADPHVKLLHLQPKVQRTLEMTGMDQLFAAYTDQAAAVDSF